MEISAHDKRRLELDGMTKEELDAEIVKIMGEGVAIMDHTKAVETLLDLEFPGSTPMTLMLACSKCERRTPHRTILRADALDGKTQQMQCVICKTTTHVPSEPRDQFQDRVDTPDQSDFSEAGSG